MARAFKTGITSDGDIVAGINLKSNYQSGDEGGEIFLNKPVTGTTLNTGVTIDVNGDRLRFFENGGTNRGFYIDIASGGTSVGTNLAGTATDTNYYPSAIVFNAGTTAGPTLDLTMSGSGAPDLTAVAIPSASGTDSGVVTTGTQTFAGTKTFSSTITADISGNSGTVTNGVYTTNIGSTVQAYDADLTAIAGLTSAADRLPYYTGSGTASLATFTSFGRSLVDDADAAAGRSTLGLVIGTNVQAYDAELAALAGLTSAADRVPYFTGSGTAALATFTSFGRSLVEDADAAAGRSTLGATTVGGNLFTLANPSTISWPRINADNTVTARSAANTRTDLGLGTMATQASTSYAALTGATFTGDVNFRVAGNTGISIGRTDGSASVNFIDFNNGATVVDYDTRIYSSGGTGTSGQGNLTFYASNVFMTGNADVTGYVSASTDVEASERVLAGGAIQHNTRTSTTTESASGMYASPSGFLSLSRNGTPLIINHYAGSGTVYPVQFYYTGTASGRISMTSGGTPAFTSGSDYRMKENVVPIEDAVQRMKKAKAYTFNKIESVDPTMHSQTGFLAHELAEVHPEAVVGEKDAVDENGDPIYQEVMEAKIIPIMAQAINDLIGMVETLTARVELLENK
jgi:hypothetical protein